MARTKNLIAVAALAVALAAGCTSTPVSAPQDGQILASANPTVIRLDNFANPAVTVGTSVITAQVLNAGGVPQPNVEVFFSADGGTLASTGAIETDDSGRVTDTLTVQLGDASPVTVTVNSGTVEATIPIVVDEASANQAPFAVIDISPAGSALFDQFVDFDGTLSEDPDGDQITCFQWRILTGENIVPEIACLPPFAGPRCEIIQGTDLDDKFFSRFYTGDDVTDEQQLRIRLLVSDDPSIACPDDGPATPLAAFNGIFSTTYDIVCDRTPPAVNAGPNRTVQANGLSQVTVTFSGSGSDLDSPPVTYEWDCGPDSIGPDPIQASQGASCVYNTADSPVTATFTVTNDCLLESEDSVVITIDP